MKYQRLDPAECRVLVNSQAWKQRLSTVGDCHLIDCHLSHDGYPQISLNGRNVYAHRVALVAKIGRDIGDGMQVGHECHDSATALGLCEASREDPCHHRRCVNPEHLAEQSRRENTLRSGNFIAEQAQRMECPNGHRLEGENLVASVRSKGRRGCRTCHQERAASQHQAVLAARTALGMTRAEYGAMYGWSEATALAVASAANAGMPIPRGRTGHIRPERGQVASV